MNKCILPPEDLRTTDKTINSKFERRRAEQKQEKAK